MSLSLRSAWLPCLGALLALALGQAACAAGPGDVKVLIGHLKDKDESVRLKAAKELGKLKGQAKDAIPALTAALKDPDEDVRAVALKSLAAIRDDLGYAEISSEKIDLLVKSLKATDTKTKLAAIEKLGELGPEARAAGAALVQHGMMSQTRAIREAASTAFEKIDQVVHKEVLTFLIDENAQRQAAAVTALEAMGPKARAAVPALQGKYLMELRGTGSQPGKPNLILLAALAAIAPADRSIQSEILGLVSVPDWESGEGGATGGRPTVIRLMHSVRVDNKQKFTALREGLAVAKFYRALFVAEIGKLGVDARPALPLIMKLKLDPDLTVREAAGAAVEAIREAKE